MRMRIEMSESPRRKELTFSISIWCVDGGMSELNESATHTFRAARFTATRTTRTPFAHAR
jgi:hypothetical protein